MTPLALAGTAQVSGFAPSAGGRRSLYRLTSVGDESIQSERDIPLVASELDLEQARSKGHRIICTVEGRGMGLLADSQLKAIHLPASAQYVSAGDVIGIDTNSGHYRVLYRRNSAHNSFLVTDRCNHYCLMCSQPPKNVDDSWLLDELFDVVPLIDPATPSIGFTGGEPFLQWQKFSSVIARAKESIPNTRIQVLTNGRAFAKTEIVNAWAAVNHAGADVAIPVYSAIDHIHNYVVQSDNAFHETVLGILHLKDRGMRVEIRVVLHSITAPRIEETCNWIARNLPFVDHVALMGMENIGFALANEELLWIDPIDYRDQLANAVVTLDRAGIATSIYNLPLCLLSPSVREFAVKSISDWKNAFPPACSECEVKSSCSGFFSSGRPKLSRAITPIRN